jgi:hypothetical protein
VPVHFRVFCGDGQDTLVPLFNAGSVESRHLYAKPNQLFVLLAIIPKEKNSFRLQPLHINKPMRVRAHSVSAA